jgi:hypothetical protein
VDPFEYGSDNVRASTPAINLHDKNWLISVKFDPTVAASATADKRTNRAGAGSVALSTSSGYIYRKQSSGLWIRLVDSSDLTALFPSGVGMEWWGAAAPSGWIFASGTIGNANSNASNRANADTFPLFKILWENTTYLLVNTVGTVVARGASAAADFALNRALSVVDGRGAIHVGKENMGGTAAGRIQVTRTDITFASGSNSAFASGGPNGIVAGMTITAPGFVPTGTTVTAKSTDALTFTMSNNATANSTANATARFSMAGDPQTLGAVGGEIGHPLVGVEIAGHNHGVTTGGQSDNRLHPSSSNNTVNIGGSGAGYGARDSNTAVSSGTLFQNVSSHPIATDGSGDSHNNFQPGIVCNYILKL